jgi:hypothetical protein
MTDSGYVTTYTKNTNGTYSCTILTETKDSNQTIIKTPLSTPNFPINTYTATKKTINIDCIAILNSNSLVSPNNTAQILIMSSDNKYIFIPTVGNINDYIEHKILFYYFIAYTILKYKTQIPLLNYTTMMNDYTQSPNYNTDDSVYNTIPNSALKDKLKRWYRSYLTGLNPPNILLEISSDTNVWKSIGYLNYTLYNYYKEGQKLNPDLIESNIPIPGTIISKNLCIKTDTNDVLVSISKYDCRNIPNGSPIISQENDIIAIIFGSISGLISSGSSCCSCILIILLIIYLLGGFSSKNSRQVIIRRK